MDMPRFAAGCPSWGQGLPRSSAGPGPSIPEIVRRLLPPLLRCHKFARWCSPTCSQESAGAVNDDDTEDEDPSPASSQKRESNAIHPWSRYYNNADKRRRRAPPALPQPQEAGVGPSGAGPSGLGPSAAAPPAAAPAQAPAADPVAPGLGCDKQQAP